MQDLNSKNLKTKSNKIRKASLLIQYMVNKIEQCTDIRRMIYYSTKNPLSSVGISYNNEKVAQPEVEIEKIKSNIFDVGFNPDIISSLSTQIFVNLTKGRFNSSQNKLSIDVNIIVPETYIRTSNGYRHFEIAQSIANLFDDNYITMENTDSENEYLNLGSLKFELVGIANGRLSKTDNYAWFTMNFEVELLSGKYRTRVD